MSKLPTMPDDTLYKYSSIGCYPLFYLGGDNCILCQDCANESLKSELESERPVACGANLGNPMMHCESCGERIESAYAEDEYEEIIGMRQVEDIELD